MPDLRITVSGEDQDRDTALSLLRSVLTVSEISRPYPNRHDPGARVYLRATAPTPCAPAASPLALAEDAKRARDLGREIGVLTVAGRDLEAQPWYPLQGGDVVLTYMPDSALAGGPLSETYLAVHDGIEVRLREVANSYSAQLDTAGSDSEDHADTDRAVPAGLVDVDQLEHADEVDGEQLGAEDDDQDDAPEAPGELLASIWDLWFEWGPAAITVIRAGTVVYGTPGRTRPTAKSQP